MRHEHKLFATASSTSFPRELQHRPMINSFLPVSRWVLQSQMHRNSISSWTQRSLSTHWHPLILQCAGESTLGQGFSCSLPSFPASLLFNRAGHCCGYLWLPHSAAARVPLRADRETEQLLTNSTERSATAAERRKKQKVKKSRALEVKPGWKRTTAQWQGCHTVRGPKVPYKQGQ